MNADRHRALLVTRIVILALLVLFAAMLVGVVIAIVADPSAVLLPTALAGLVATIGLAVLLSAYGQRRSGFAAAQRGLRLAATAWSILVVGAAAVAGLGLALGAMVSDGSVALIGLGSATGPALAAILAATARRQFGTASADGRS